MKRIGLLLLLATTIIGASPALSQDQNGDRRDRGGPNRGPDSGGRPREGGPGDAPPTARPDRVEQNMQQQQRRDRDNVGQGRGTDVQRQPQSGRDFQQSRPGYDRGNPDDRGDYNRGDGNRGDRNGGSNYSRNRPPAGNYWRPGDSRPSSNYWRNNHWNNRPVYAPSYRYPRGYGYRQWRPGLILPSLFFGSSYYFDGFGDLGLPAPPYGYRWVRYGPDLVLVDIRSGRIRDVRYGVFG